MVRVSSTIFMMALMDLMDFSWAIMSIGYLRGGVVLQGYSGFGVTVWSRSVETSQEEEEEHVLNDTPLVVGEEVLV